MAAEAENLSTTAQNGSVSDGNHSQALSESKHLAIDRIASFEADKVIFRVPFNTDIVQSVALHSARIQHILEQLEPKLAAQRDEAENNKASPSAV